MRHIYLVSIPEISYSLAFTFRHDMEDWIREYHAFIRDWQDQVNGICSEEVREIVVPEKFREVISQMAKKYCVDELSVL